MPKERSVNPAQAARKAEKQKAIRKSKAALSTLKTEKLAKKNPERLQSQLDDLLAITKNGGTLTSHEENVKNELERDIKAVRKAREVMGDKAPPLRGYSSGRYEDRGVLGKRGRDGARKEITGSSTEESEVDEDVRRIPMPRDTPPPIPKEILDKWHNRKRERLAAQRERDGSGRGTQGTNANNTPLGGERRQFEGKKDEAPKVVVEAKTTYESAPVIRDLRKEAISAFVPAVVRAKMDKTKGVGGLIEPEEADRLEKEGYLKSTISQSFVPESKAVTMEEVEDEDD